MFGYSESRGGSLDAFQKWRDVLTREQREAADYATDCAQPDPSCPRCIVAQWGSFLAKLRDRPRLEQLQKVHSFMNRMPWVDDRINYGRDDYWATPTELLTRGGDCEDYAFAKYVSLRRLGYRPEQMRLLVLNDLNAGQPHAVLLVNLDDQVWVLDNLSPMIARTSIIRHFQPIYSINETAWWLHRPATDERVVASRR